MFSQREEESYILDLEGDGRLLDIGSYDGKTFSNARALAERGWEGVYVEPAAHAFASMLEDPPPNGIYVHAAIGAETGLVPFFHSKDAVSTTSPKHARKWRSVPFQSIYTVSLTLSDLLKEFPGPYRFISIDTESTSMAIFKELVPLLDDLETELVCVEHDGANPKIQGWESVYRSEENEVLRRCA